MALSSVVQGKEVESDAIVLHRQLERESLSIYLLFVFFPLPVSCIIVFVERPADFFSTQIEMSSADTENKLN